MLRDPDNTGTSEQIFPRNLPRHTILTMTRCFILFYDSSFKDLQIPREAAVAQRNKLLLFPSLPAILFLILVFKDGKRWHNRGKDIAFQASVGVFKIKCKVRV